MTRLVICLIAMFLLIPGISVAWDDWDDNEQLEQERIQRKYPRRHMGKRYKYDMLNPGDKARYEMDLPTQMREEWDLNNQMRMRNDAWGGRFRGPAKNWEVDP